MRNFYVNTIEKEITMKQKTRALSFYLLILLVFAFPLYASASNYITWEQGDYGVYKANLFDKLVKASVDQSSGSGKHFTQFAGFSDLWVISFNETTYVYDAVSSRISLLTDFNAGEGFQSRVALMPCNVGITTIGAKGLTVIVPAGTFSDVIRLDMTTSCADAGVTSIWFAAGAGPIKWTELNIAGTVTYELVEGNIAGKTYPVQTGVVLKGRFPEPVVWINMMPTFPIPKPVPSVDVFLTIGNETTADLTYSFNTSQRFDIELRDINGRVVKKWSDDKFFLQVLGTETIKPGQNYTIGGTLDLVDSAGITIPEGSYTLAINLTSTGQENTSHAPGVPAPTLLTPVAIKWAY